MVGVGLVLGLMVVLGILVNLALSLCLLSAGNDWPTDNDWFGCGFLSWWVFELLKAKELAGIAARWLLEVGCCNAAVLLHDECFLLNKPCCLLEEVVFGLSLVIVA